MDSKDLKGLMEAYQQVHTPEQLDEAIYSEKGKAKAAEMIAKRSTPSGRAKPGKGANVAQIKQIRGSGRGDFDKEGLGGTPMTPTIAKNPRKKQNYTGTGNKAARRAGLTPTREKPNAWKEELDIFDVVLEFLQAEGFAETLEEAEWMMANVIDEEAIAIITELTGGKGHPGYKAGSKDHGPMQSGHPADTFKRTMKGGTMSQRHGDHLGDLDDDDDEDDLEAGLKDSARKRRENVRKPLRDKVKAARKKMAKEEYVDEADSIAAMRERAAKRREQRYGKSGGGGRDDFRPYTKADYERGEKKSAKEEVEVSQIRKDWADAYAEVYEAKADAGLTPLQKIRKRNKAYAMPGEKAGEQTSNRRAERASARGEKKERGAKSAFGTMRNVGGPYK